MPVTILDPMSGDTVQNPVTITSGHFDLSDDEVVCKIATRQDNVQTLDGTEVHRSGPINNIPAGSQTVQILVNTNNVADTQEGVIVTDGELPVPIDPVEPDDGVGNLKNYTVRGKVPDGSIAAYVVCQVIEVNLATRTRTVVRAGAASLEEGKTWKVPLKIDVNNDDRFRYVVRAFAYDKTQRLLASQTRVAEKSRSAKKP